MVMRNSQHTTNLRLNTIPKITHLSHPEAATLLVYGMWERYYNTRIRYYSLLNVKKVSLTLESDYCDRIIIIAQQNGEIHRVQIEFNEGMRTITGYDVFMEFIVA